MIPIWLAALIVVGASIGFVVIIFLICYGFVAFLKVKDKFGGEKSEKSN